MREPGTTLVAPLAAVNSLAAHMTPTRNSGRKPFV